ncbi:MAG: glycosyltransferase family 2 protein [Bacteroidetes bacterium]|nr:MAG: glycosyltransferase family 2 protein [Bacteroidota bacterium]
MIYIVIPVFNRKEKTRNCLLSLRKQRKQDFRVIVVDDASTDGTAEMIADEFPEVILLKGTGNLWWTGSINLGIRHALSLCEEQDYIMPLNDDLTVEEDYIEKFYALSRAYPNSLIQSVVAIKDDGRARIHDGGILINWFSAKFSSKNVGKLLSDFAPGHVEHVSTVTGRGVLIPQRVFREVGLYNEKHYQHRGDTEFPIRARRAGYQLLVAYDVPVFNYVEDGSHINHRKRFKPGAIKTFFFHVSSSFYLPCRFWFAYDTAPNPVQGTVFFVLDLLRISKYFLSRLSF